jgi:hypothetical protein
MIAAKIAAEMLHAWARTKFEDLPAEMASTIANGEIIDVFDHQGGGSHKYIPADRLTQDLGEPLGAGVYGYWKMYDDSYLLRTCDGRLAYWDGTSDGKAEFAK